MNETIASLERQLNDFDAEKRNLALRELWRLAEAGIISLAPEEPVANMHCHTFFSFNAFGYSPSAIAWLAKRRGYALAGTVDFDVLDAVEEFLDACDLLGVRGTTGIETRVFIPEFADKEINSPGEPGISYQMGIGFVSGRVPPEAAGILEDLRQRAAQRNLGVLDKVNDYLDPLQLDYGRDVLPLAPGGNPTERHMVLAYIKAAERIVPNPASFWAGKLEMTADAVAKLMGEPAKFQNQLRAKLMKRGGVGYVAPNPQNFPTLADLHRLVLACGALPCAAWLDGTSAGEREFERLLRLEIAQGAVAMNIIPDRNWNITDPETRRTKIKHLYDVVEMAQALDLPLNVGTEMNAFGQKEMDDFDAPELAPVRQAFLDGAYFVYGHTALQRGLGLGYQSAWAAENLPDRRARNDFYTRVGKRVRPGVAGRRQMSGLAPGTPSTLLDKLS